MLTSDGMRCGVDTEKYLKQARINEELVLFLARECESKIFFKWIFVSIFYSALHYFHAFLSNRGDAIPDHHVGELGGNDIATDKFYTTKNGISDSVGGDYNQLFQWGFDVRYKPERASLLGKENLDAALNSLERIKLVTFNDVGFMPKKSRSGRSVMIQPADSDYVNRLYESAKRSSI